jgi:hypothetical protein
MKISHFLLAGSTAIIIGGVTFAFLREAEPRQAPDATAAAPALLSVGETDSEASHATGKENPRPVQVDELVMNPDGYKGRVIIRGVVAGVNQEEGVVALIDSREFEECGTVACALNLLPVRVNGALPKALSLVQVIGEVTRGTNGLEVRAESVEDVR